MSKNFYGQQTRFEKTNGRQTATYFETIEWYENLEKQSKIVSLKKMGQTDAGYPLHLVLMSSDGKNDPRKWHQQKKVVILINNGIHPGEPDGIDASMMLARDISNKKIRLPENVALAFIPVYNIGGALNRNSYTRVNQNGPEEYGFRGNSQNLDLNRDFTKNDSREARSFAEIFHFLDPDIFIDNHVSDGADFQHTMTLITTQYDKLGSSLGTYLKDTLEPRIYAGMTRKGWDMIPYMDFETLDIEKGTVMFNETPRFSTGYAALFNTMGFMPETHMLKPYGERVRSTYDLMVTFIEDAGKHAKEIIAERAKAKKQEKEQESFTLNWKADMSRYAEINFKGYEKVYSHSEATGLQKMGYDRDKPFTAKMKFFNGYVPKDVVQKPKAYIIAQGWEEVMKRLKINGVKWKRLKKDTTITVSRYRIENFQSLPYAYEKHHRNHSITTSSSIEKIRFLKGDYMIETDQDVNRYIVEMLEPVAGDGFFSWNFFDGILQKKEGYSDYRWEELAAEELKQNPGLRATLDARKTADPQFAANTTEILDFIYKNSKYYERAHLNYPVYRLEK